MTMECNDSEEFKLGKKFFEIDKYDNVLIFGYPILGGWIPMLFFETVNIKPNEEVTMLTYEWFCVVRSVGIQK